MLEKIIEIANIGRFIECKNIELADINLIYAENGCGKSTLSAILRSLSSGDSKIIIERSTIGETKEPVVKLLFEGNHFVSCEKGRWSGDAPHFEVFDDIFVSENIYAGHEITSDHRTNLYEFAIGSLAVQLRQEEKDLDAKIEKLDSERKQVKKFLRSRIEIDFDEFIQLDTDDDVSDKIEQLEKKIKNAESQDVIQSKEKLSKVDILELDLKIYSELLQKTLEDISGEAESDVKKHIELHMKGDEAENWIESGLRLKKSDKCPFCEQTLNNSSIIDSYQDYFNQRYSDLKSEINDAIQELPHMLSDNKLIELQRKDSANAQRYEFWSNKLDIPAIVLDVEAIQENWQNIRKSLSSSLVEKQQAPLEVLSADIATITRLHQEVQNHIRAYNTTVHSINEAIEGFKDRTASSDLKDLRAKLSHLEQVKLRSDDLKSECENYLDLESTREKLVNQRQKAKEKLDEENERFLAEYQEDINKYLEDFGTDFRIKNKLDRRSRGKNRWMMQAEINGEEVDISNSKDGRPNFKNTLSTGDKTSLALAFFFCKLNRMNDSQLENTIVVLDDPITSLGMHRKKNTVYEIFDIARQVKQLFVLSHNAHFLYDLSRNLSHLKDSNRRLLEIQSVASNESEFVDWNIDSTLKDDFHIHYERVMVFVENHSTGASLTEDDIRSSIRNILEGVLQYRYPTDFPKSGTLGNHLTIIKGVGVNHRLYDLQTDENLMQMIERANQYSSQSHHTGDSLRTNRRELRTFAEKVLKFAQGKI